VKVFQDTEELDEEAAALKEYRLRMAALLPTATSVPSQKIQTDLDANFDAFMDAEYADDQIGELEEDVDNEDKINPAVLMDAVDEFIEDKKMWFRDLHQKHGDEEERDIPVLVAKNSEALRQIDIGEDEDASQVIAELKSKMVDLGARFNEEAEADESNPFEKKEGEEEEE